MKIVICSFKRHDTIRQKTLSVLLNAGYQPEEIDLFVANQNEYNLYKSVVPEGINIIIGVEGLKEIREFVFNYYDEGTHILSIDDDIEIIRQYDKETNKLIPVKDLKSVVERGFSECIKNDLKLWGLYPVQGNPFFMKNSKEITYDYKFIIGNFFGCINCKDMNQLHVTNIDDYERSIRSYMIYGGSVRLNHFACKTNFKKNQGGAQCDSNRESKIKDDMNLLVEMYPNMIFLRQKKNGLNPILKQVKNK